MTGWVSHSFTCFNSASVSSPRRWQGLQLRRRRGQGFNSASVSSPRRYGEPATAPVYSATLQFGLGVVTEEMHKNRHREAAPAVKLQFGLGVVTEEIATSPAPGTKPGRASIRPRCRHRGDAVGGVVASPPGGASIRPRCRHRGDAAAEGDGEADRRASIRPRCRHRGDLAGRCPASGSRASFNSASVSSPRRWDRGRSEPFTRAGASIRPRCRHRGDRHVAAGHPAVDSGFNSASVSSPRRSDEAVRDARPRPAVRRAASIRPRCRHRGDASTGAEALSAADGLQFGLGVVTEEIFARLMVGMSAARLQFGLGVVTEEMPRCSTGPARTPCFNSASVSSPRRSPRPTPSTPRPHAGLQFGLGVVTEEIRADAAVHPVHPLASIRPRCRHRGDRTPPTRSTRPRPRFNSASVSSPRRSVHRPT